MTLCSFYVWFHRHSPPLCRCLKVHRKQDCAESGYYSVWICVVSEHEKSDPCAALQGAFLSQNSMEYLPREEVFDPPAACLWLKDWLISESVLILAQWQGTIWASVVVLVCLSDRGVDAVTDPMVIWRVKSVRSPVSDLWATWVWCIFLAAEITCSIRSQAENGL